jgi:hypothetical protein
MPIVGDLSRFAVEYALNKNHGTAWMFGHFCYWCVTGLAALQPFDLPLWISAMYSRLYWRSIADPQPPSPGEHRVLVTAQLAF